MTHTKSIKRTALVTYAIEARTPGGKWFTSSQGLTAVEADTYRTKYAQDRDVRVVAEVLF